MTTLDPGEDRWHLLDAPGAYEWSYFDGMSADGEWGFVAIWFRGVPMSPYYTAAIDRFTAGRGAPPSPADYSAFNINLYHRGRRIFFALHEGGAPLSASPVTTDAAHGDNRIITSTSAAGGRRYRLEIDTRLLLGRKRLHGTIDVEAPPPPAGSGGALTIDPTAAGDWWVPAAPDAAFAAELSLGALGRERSIRFAGRAYHDRNFGGRPLHHISGDWHWGRIHSEGRVFVYFLVSSPDSADRFSCWRLFEEGRQEAGSDRLTMERALFRPHWTGLPRPTLLEAADEAGTRLEVRPISTLDAGPFYHRNLSEVTVRRQGMETLTGRGITEFLRPSRLGVAGFRPFVKFRVRRD